MARDEDDNPEAKLARKSEAVAKKISKPFWVAIIMLPVMIVLFIAGLMLLVTANQQAGQIVAEKPENKVEAFAKNISTTQEKAARQYNKHLDKMEDDSIFNVNKKFRTMYQISQESESDYVSLINTYQKLSYDIASRTNGSGEWFYYYDQKLSRLLAEAQARERKMVEYFRDE